MAFEDGVVQINAALCGKAAEIFAALRRGGGGSRLLENQLLPGVLPIEGVGVGCWDTFSGTTNLVWRVGPSPRHAFGEVSQALRHLADVRRVCVQDF